MTTKANQDPSLHVGDEITCSESPSRVRTAPPSPEEMNQRAAKFWDVEAGWSDEMRERALERMQVGAGTWEDFVAFARDFRARAAGGTCHPQTIEWLCGALENVLNGKVPPAAFGASKQRGAKPDLQRKFRLAALRELLRRKGYSATQINSEAMRHFGINERNLEKLQASSRVLNFRKFPLEALQHLIDEPSE